MLNLEDAMDIVCLYSRSVDCSAECWAAWWCESEGASSDTDVDRRTRARAFRTCSHTSHIHEQQLRWHNPHHHHDHQTLRWQGNLILQPTFSEIRYLPWDSSNGSELFQNCPELSQWFPISQLLYLFDQHVLVSAVNDERGPCLDLWWTNSSN